MSAAKTTTTTALARTPILWGLLGRIPYGQTTTYAELARALGNPALARAVGAANARNPLSIVVPCHRVVGSDGRLTGYGGGLVRKRRLLELETSSLDVTRPRGSRDPAERAPASAA